MARMLLEQKLTLQVAGLKREISVKVDDDGSVWVEGSIDIRVIAYTWPQRDLKPGDVWVHLNGTQSELRIDVHCEGGRNWWPSGWRCPGLDVGTSDRILKVTARGGVLKEDVELASVPV